MLVVNLKAFDQTTGKKALTIAKKIQSICKKTKVQVVICAQTVDIAQLSSQTSLPIYAQHVDPVEPGDKTGYITLESLKQAGAKGVLINHSEHLMNTNDIEFVVNKAKKLGMKTIVCASDPWIAEALVRFRPDYVAIQPTELIANKITVSKIEPQIISNSIGRFTVRKAASKILMGAGIQSAKDVSKSLALGTEGVIVSSAVIKAKDPAKAVADLLSGFF